MPAGRRAAAAGAMLRIDGFDESHVLELRLLPEFEPPARSVGETINNKGAEMKKLGWCAVRGRRCLVRGG
jgi:hypothetical protein